jgi:hypothetical protein
MITIEDTLEILAGGTPRRINIRLDTADIRLLTSLKKQLAQKIPLTDRQLDLSLKKIEKYRENLEKCNVDVDHILTVKPLKWPLRVIDRTQSVEIETDSATNKPVIVVKYVFSKKFAEFWAKVEEHTSTYNRTDKGVKKIPYSEKCLHLVVQGLVKMNFTISSEVQEIYEKIEKVLENPENFVPYLDYAENTVVLKNLNSKCENAIVEKFGQRYKCSIFEYVDYAKSLGVTLKTQNLIKYLSENAPSVLTKKISIENSTRYRLYPEDYSLEELFSAVDTFNQWPLVIVVEENDQVLSIVSKMVNELSKIIPKEKINVFFRLKNEQPEYDKFNQFIRDNGLNNYIDSTTKVVFISRGRIPKPLLKADWKPTTAIITSNHDFGRMAAYLNDFSTVYYYNSSVSLRNSRLKGADKIVQL